MSFSFPGRMENRLLARDAFFFDVSFCSIDNSDTFLKLFCVNYDPKPEGLRKMLIQNDDYKGWGWGGGQSQ